MFIRDLYEAPAKRIVAVMPGGFHPFHPGHKSLYDWAVKTFGQGNVYVAATNDTAARPFPFDVKKKLAGMAGVPKNNFIQVKSPFNAMSYQDIVDDNTALVFVRSEKDKAEHPKPDQTKKNGEPGYLRTYTGKNLNSSDEMGYMAYGPTTDFEFSSMQIKSASELRSNWPTMSNDDKHKAAALMYGNGHDVAVQLLDKALGGSNTPVEEDVVDEWVVPALKGGKYAFQIAKFFWNNKWAIGFLTVSWKTYRWISDAIAWIKPLLDNPIVRGLSRYGLPAVAIAVALYGGKKLYDELVKAQTEKDLEKIFKDFEPDKDELEELMAEFERLNKEEQPVGESNPFTDARMNAIKAGKSTFKAGSKTYKVTGDTSDEENAVQEDISVTDVAAMAAVAGLAAPVMASLIKGAYKTGKNLLQLKKIANKAGVKLANRVMK